MKHIEIKLNDGQYTATIKLGSHKKDLVVVQTIEAATEIEIQAALMDLGFHQQDIFDALAVAQGKSANAPHPFFDEGSAIAKKGKK